MDRWTGLLNLSLSKDGAGPFFKIAASLLLSPSKTLAHSAINAWVVEASTYNGGFAVYKEMIPTVNSKGEPNQYDATGFPASSSIVSVMSACVNEIQDKLSINTSEESIPPTSSPNTVILGFSKGGTVVSQLVTEVASLATRLTRNSQCMNTPEASDNFIFPTSTESFLKSISVFHYIDVGLNGSGAYLTDKQIFRDLGNYLVSNDKCISIFLHGTPRQWSDSYRPWIRKEKDLMLHFLRQEACRCEGKLKVFERFYFGDKAPSLRMHFEIIDAINLS